VSFARALAETARRFGDRPSLVWDSDAMSHADLDDRAARAARALADAGVRPGDRLAISIVNSWQFVVAVLAGLRAGALVAPLDPRLSGGERAAILSDLRPVRVVEDVPPATGGRLGPLVPVGPALALYTSGSTGRPKGALLSHRALELANRSWAGPVMGLTERDVVLGVLPLSHSFGLNGALLAPLLTGAAVHVLERFSSAGVAAALAHRAVTVFPGVATMFRRCLDRHDFAGGPALRLAVSGAAPCPWELADAWRKRTGVRIVRGYGMTELFRPISFRADDAADVPESIGRAVPGVDLRVVDEGGEEVAAGEVGELLIKTSAMMDGYLGAAEESHEVIDADGFFHTGDLARVGVDGFVTIAGRKRDRILRGGHSVFPAEVEAALLQHPAVAEAAVIGLPHADLGEEVAAFVTLRSGARLTADELIAHARARLAGFKYPRRVTIVEALPRSATGKVLKSKLRD